METMHENELELNRADLDRIDKIFGEMNGDWFDYNLTSFSEDVREDKDLYKRIADMTSGLSDCEDCLIIAMRTIRKHIKRIENGHSRETKD